MSAQPSPESPSPCSMMTVALCCWRAGRTIGSRYANEEEAAAIEMLARNARLTPGIRPCQEHFLAAAALLLGGWTLGRSGRGVGNGEIEKQMLQMRRPALLAASRLSVHRDMGNAARQQQD